MDLLTNSISFSVYLSEIEALCAPHATIDSSYICDFTLDLLFSGVIQTSWNVSQDVSYNLDAITETTVTSESISQNVVD